jgi:hypothetical protein
MAGDREQSRGVANIAMILRVLKMAVVFLIGRATANLSLRTLLHGDIFVKSFHYPSFALVSKRCSDRLVNINYAFRFDTQI